MTAQTRETLMKAISRLAASLSDGPTGEDAAAPAAETIRAMTERLADISARIESVRQLGAVVNAMKGIAAARAHTARAQIEAVDSYAATIAAGMSSALVNADNQAEDHRPAPGETGLLVFTAEQGFRRRLQRTRARQH
jgi:hypothetical protein